MAMGRNPHVVKAQAAEQKAREARDTASRERAWREAAHLWERAAQREAEGKRHDAYLASAQEARDAADQAEKPEDGDVGALVIRLADVQARRRPEPS
jgi:hypothetical protein